MLTLPETRQQWLIDLMSAPESAVEETFDPAETLNELMERYANCSVEPIRDKVMRLENYLLTLPQAVMPMKHYICNGMYYRELFIPKGVVLTGEIHRSAHLCIMLRGDITILSDNGLKRINEPCCFESEGMIKRAGFAHEDTIFINIHRTDKTDPDEALLDCIVKGDDHGSCS